MEPKKKPVTKKKPTPAELKRKDKAKQKEDKETELLKRIDEIIFLIEDNGYSLRKSLKIKQMSSSTFFDRMDKDPSIEKRYARACKLRADAIVEEIYDIADDNSRDTTLIYDRNGNPIPVEDKEWTARARMRIDVRKWHASKLNPKKYGDRIEVAGDPDAPVQTTIINLGSGIKPENG